MKIRELIFITITGILFLGAAALANQVGSSFSDVASDHDHARAIDYLQQEKVVEGYPDGTFRPDNRINRAEYLKIVLGASGQTSGGSDCYTDVTDQWFAPYVCKATELGIVQGYPDGLFHPERTIVFTEASKIVVNSFNTNFDSTVSGQTEWYEPYIIELESLKAIPPQISRFDYQVTRGQMAEIAWRLGTENQSEPTNTLANLQTGKALVGFAGAALVAFDSCSELTSQIETIANSLGGDLDAAVPMLVPTTAAEIKDESSAGSTRDASTTNVQVAGVDEADIVKNDTDYIYVLKGNSVRIVKAYPTSNLNETAIFEFSNDNFVPADMYLDGNRVIVLGNIYNDFYPVEFEDSFASEIFPAPSNYATQIYIIDVTNHNIPKVERTFSIEGSLSNSRKIDDTVYVVTSKSNYYYDLPEDPGTLIPQIFDTQNSKTLPVNDCNEILYNPNRTSISYTTVTALPLAKSKAAKSTTILGSSENIYASLDHLYIAESSSDYRYWNDDQETIIHKFDLDPEDVAYLGDGKVAGTILNQFSMDEYDNYFRIATTDGHVWDNENPATNNLYVLDENLDTVGRINNIAPGEQIYSVRFTGKRAYMVTFKKVDPLFVIDLSNPTKPDILGALKIPGFSDYLHPFDENHIIGFGLDTVEASEFEKENRDLDFAWYQGVKIAMFDVTDVTAPKEQFREIIGDRGTDSPLLQNHKALLFAHGKGSTSDKALMALPIRLSELSDEAKASSPANTYGDYVGQYAYVYDVSLEDGFELRKRITHYENADHNEYYRQDRNINRIVYIGNALYTVSRAMVQAHKMSDLSDLNQVELEDRGDDNYYWW